MTEIRLKLYLLMLPLCLSGAAGLMNQVVWQRALKVFLGGSETISSTIVVLVFLAGLGAGSAAISRNISRFCLPSRIFARIEFALAAVNLVISHVLSLDFSENVYWVQRAVVAWGFPLRLIYGLGATLLLALPCLLMGTTSRLAQKFVRENWGFTRAVV
jgi:predicted membrane-bound spermidine synthase